MNTFELRDGHRAHNLIQTYSPTNDWPTGVETSYRENR
jgi:hypothetical protein